MCFFPLLVKVNLALWEPNLKSPLVVPVTLEA